MDQYWTWVPEALDRGLRQLTALAPLTFDEAECAASEVGLPDDPDWRELLAAAQSPVTRRALGWIRPSRSSRDLAYLWLKAEGEPRSADDISAVAECSAHAIRETMRRDGAFAQVRPEGTWALSDWRVPGSGNRYSNAVDVVVEVLRDLGPLDYERLRVETQRRYPVSSWRINQCLSSNQVGLDSEGLYDLVERGASPIEDTEPKRPNYMAAQGSVVGVQLTVDHDLLRGSGIPVNRWLSWHLGLRTAPTIRYFDLPDGFGSLTCKRATSNAQLSSLRVVAQALGVQDGCKLTVILRTDVNTATVRHDCSPDVCPALGQRAARLDGIGRG